MVYWHMMLVPVWIIVLTDNCMSKNAYSSGQNNSVPRLCNIYVRSYIKKG